VGSCGLFGRGPESRTLCTGSYSPRPVRQIQNTRCLSLLTGEKTANACSISEQGGTGRKRAREIGTASCTTSCDSRQEEGNNKISFFTGKRCRCLFSSTEKISVDLEEAALLHGRWISFCPPSVSLSIGTHTTGAESTLQSQRSRFT
jgi:hypothetical protein